MPSLSNALPARRRALVALWLLVAAGCGSPAPTSKGSASASAASSASSATSNELLSSALTMLDQLERYNEQKIQIPTKSADANAEPQFLAVVKFANPDSLNTIVDRLNLWSEAIDHGAWKPDPILETLPAELTKKLPSFERLSATRFSRESEGPGFVLHDGWALQQTLWLHDAAASAAGTRIDELERARKLFDWTVRNIQLVDPAARISAESPVLWRDLPLDPWHALLLGRGQALHRAWIFMLLARQQELDVVLLARENPDKPGGVEEWAVALVEKRDAETPADKPGEKAGEKSADKPAPKDAAKAADPSADKPRLYLFDPALGLPIPGPEGAGVATLDQVRADDKLLRALDADAEHPYPLKSADLTRLLALIETGPSSMARRMHDIQAHVVSSDRLILAAETGPLVKRLEAAGLAARAWERPYRNQAEFARLPQPVREQFQRLLLPLEDVPLLWNGRASHLRGRYTGERNAFSYYLKVHIPDEAIEAGRDHLGNPFTEPQRRLIRVAKGHAAYWMGLASYEMGDLRAAANHLAKRTLEQQPGGPFTTGARYNLGRAYEALGEQALAKGDAAAAKAEFARAADVLTDAADATSPARAGNVLRARTLRTRAQ